MTAGLANFKRSMTTRFPGVCEWCGTATRAGVDYAALGHDGKWIASCTTCSVSMSAMIHGVCTRIAAVQDTLSAEQLATLSMPADLAEGIQGTLSPAETTICLANVVAVWKAVEAFTRVTDPRMVALRAMPNPSAFVMSLLGQYDAKGDLSPKQWACVDKALAAAPAADGKPAPRTGRPNRFSGKCVNCSFQVPAGHGVYSNGVVSHTVCPTFEEWCVETYGALPGSPELRDIAVAHAHSTSHCIFCGLTLDHPDSDPRQGGVGYGPVCAGKYGLPHGGSTKRGKAYMAERGMHFDPRS